MSLKDWENNGWLRPHRTGRQEIGDLMALVRRDLADACTREISADWRFGIGYNAALKLCTILFYTTGYRPAQVSAAFRSKPEATTPDGSAMRGSNGNEMERD